MRVTFKDNFLGYFRFFYNGMGYRIFINFFLCIIVSFLDGIGLAMFIPLLQAVGDSNSANSDKSLGKLHYVTDFLKNIGLGFTIDSVLTLLIILFVLKGLIKFAQLNYQVGLRFSFVSQLRKKLVDQLHQLSYSGFLKLEAGRMQNILTSEMGRLYQALTSYFNAAQSLVMLLTYIVLAFMANFQFAFFVAAGAGVSNLIYRKVYILTKKNSYESSKKGNIFNSYLIQAIHNFKYLKSTNYFAPYSKKLKQVIEHMEYINKKLGFLNSITASIKEPVIIIVVVLVIKLELNIMGATLSSILLSLLLFYRALSFLIVIQNNWQNFINSVGALNSIAVLSDEMDSMRETEVANMYKGIRHELQLHKINFSYGDIRVLNGIDITIPKNKTIAFVGESGSGKTTLANLIAGLLQPVDGEINIDKVSLKNYNLNSYRNKIGYISQEPVIFNDDIFNNITFWADPVKENTERFWKTVELASLTDFMLSLPQKEHTNLGNNGILISGGQKQRISIARELYKQAEILIMDEATSALDSETEKAIQENIERLHGSYTIIIIAHRLSTIKEADVIFLVEKGKVMAAGSFEEMMLFSERFKRMVALQEI